MEKCHLMLVFCCKMDVSPLPQNTEMGTTLKIVSKCHQCTVWFCRARHQHGACTRQPFVATGAEGQLPDERHVSDLSERSCTGHKHPGRNLIFDANQGFKVPKPLPADRMSHM